MAYNPFNLLSKQFGFAAYAASPFDGRGGHRHHGYDHPLHGLERAA